MGISNCLGPAPGLSYTPAVVGTQGSLTRGGGERSRHSDLVQVFDCTIGRSPNGDNEGNYQHIGEIVLGIRESGNESLQMGHATCSPNSDRNRI